MSEEYYDTEIAPELRRLAQLCEDRGMSFLATVEYAPEKRGNTISMTKDPCLGMTMVQHCMHTAPNIDGYIINLAHYANENGIDLSASLVMETLGYCDLIEALHKFRAV